MRDMIYDESLFQMIESFWAPRKIIANTWWDYKLSRIFYGDMVY